MTISQYSNKLVILDRDGVINEDSDDYIKSVEEWIPIPGSIEAIVNLCKLGYMVTIATNQSGIGRGLFDLDELEKIHFKLCSLVEERGGEISGIFYCPHIPEDYCDCRKPKAGLISAIENELGVAAKGSIFVGDSLRDLEAGFSKSCIPVLVKTGKGETTLKKLQTQNSPLLLNLLVFDNLLSFSESLAFS